MQKTKYTNVKYSSQKFITNCLPKWKEKAQYRIGNFSFLKNNSIINQGYRQQITMFQMSCFLVFMFGFENKRGHFQCNYSIR
jgi:hypothetical protein